MSSSRRPTTQNEDIQGTFKQINKQAEEILALTRLRENEAKEINFHRIVRQLQQTDSDSDDLKSDFSPSVFEIDSAYSDALLNLNESSNEKEMIVYQKSSIKPYIDDLEDQLAQTNKNLTAVNKQLVQARLESNAVIHKQKYFKTLIDLRDQIIKENEHLVRMFASPGDELGTSPVVLMTAELAANFENYQPNSRSASENFEDKINSLIREIGDLQVTLRLQKLENESKRIEKEAEILQNQQKNEESYAKALEEIKVGGTGQISNLRWKIETCDGEINALRSKTVSMETQLEFVKNRCNDADNAQDGLRAEGRSLKAELTKLTVKFDELSLENSLIRGRLDKIRKTRH